MQNTSALVHRPAAAAGLAAAQRDSVLGVVTTPRQGDADQHVLELVDGVLAAAADAGQDVTVFTLAHWADAPLRIPAICASGRVDGLVLIAPRLGAGVAGWLPQDTALVAIDADAPMPGVTHLAIDEEAGACRMVQHLLNMGHRRILHAAGPAGSPRAQRCVAGYLRAHAEARVRPPEDHVLHGDANVPSGRRMLREWLARQAGQPLPDAIFAGSDEIAIGCLDTLASLGFAVPADISVVGFGDTAHARVNRLATVRQPLHDMGRRAIELLLQRAEARRKGRCDAAAPDQTFPTDIVISHSLSRPRATSLLIP
jgi:DNA-binding LacI/PurR family transcriptional regulator